MMVGYVREMTVKKSSKYGLYGSVEHLFFSLKTTTKKQQQNGLFNLKDDTEVFKRSF